MTGCSIEAALVRDHLDLLRASAAFARSSSLFLLLHYVVQETLAGRGGTLKELVIGDALYGRSAPYDPRIDSTVRVEARRLRRKLADHYAGAGKDDRVRIDLPTGSYRPVFSMTEGGGGPHDAHIQPRADVTADIAIMPFRALSSSEVDESFGGGLTDELIYALERRSHLRIVPRYMVFQFQNRRYSAPEAATSLGVDAMLHGTFRTAGDHTRVTVEHTDQHGMVTWAARIDDHNDEPMLLQERIAGKIVAQMPAWVIGRPVDERSRMELVA